MSPSRPPTSLHTSRLLLRRWAASDRGAFAEMNADPRVMEFFPNVQSREESDATADRIEQQFEEHGYGLWAVEIPGESRFAGFIGMMVPRFDAHFTPCVEIGWRLAFDSWGRGYATEGATAVLQFAFESVGLDEVVAMTAVANQRSRRVMEKLGMTRDPHDDFDHPVLPPGHALQRHVLYRKRASTDA